MPRRQLTPWQEFWNDLFFGHHERYSPAWIVQRIPIAILGAVIMLAICGVSWLIEWLFSVRD